MHTLILDRRQLRLAYEADCLFVRGEQLPVRTIPLRHLQRVICLHGVELTSQLLGQLSQRGIDLVVINCRHPERTLSLPGDPFQDARRRARQYQQLQQEAVGLTLSRTLVRQKVRQQLRSLTRYGGQPGDQPLLDTLRNARRQASRAMTLASLRGVEGAAQAAWFQRYTRRFGDKWQFVRRQRRPCTDPVNALLSLSFTLLYRDAVNQIRRSGLDPWFGFYHQPCSGRYSLACDLIEPLRPWVELLVYDLLERDRALGLTDFARSRSGCLLAKSGRATFYPLFEAQAERWRRQLQGYARWLSRHLERYPLPFDPDAHAPTA